MDPLGNARLLADRIPGAELAMVAGAGHAYPLEAPEQSLELFMHWLERHEPIAPGRPNTALAARVEPVTRALGLPVGAMRTGRSLVTLVTGRLGRAKQVRRVFELPEGALRRGGGLLKLGPDRLGRWRR